MKKIYSALLCLFLLGLPLKKAFCDEARYKAYAKFLVKFPVAELTIKSKCNGDTSEIFQVSHRNRLSKYFLQNGDYYVKNKLVEIRKGDGEMNPFEFKETVLVPLLQTGRFPDIIQKIRFDYTGSKEIITRYEAFERREDLDSLLNESEVFTHKVLFRNSDTTKYIDSIYQLKKGSVDYFIDKDGKGIITGGKLIVNSWLGEKEINVKLISYTPDKSDTSSADSTR